MYFKEKSERLEGEVRCLKAARILTPGAKGYKF